MCVLIVVLLGEQLLDFKLRRVEVVDDLRVVWFFGGCRFLVGGAPCGMCGFDELLHFIFLIIELLEHFFSRDVEPVSLFSEYLRATLDHLLDRLSVF